MVGLEFPHLFYPFNVIMDSVGEFENVGFAGETVAKVVEHRFPAPAIQLMLEDDEHSVFFTKRFDIVADVLLDSAFARFVLGFFSHQGEPARPKYPCTPVPGRGGTRLGEGNLIATKATATLASAKPVGEAGPSRSRTSQARPAV
jgi:hypothetical protein